MSETTMVVSAVTMSTAAYFWLCMFAVVGLGVVIVFIARGISDALK